MMRRIGTLLLITACCCTPLLANWVDENGLSGYTAISEAEAAEIYGAQSTPCAPGYYTGQDVCPFGQADNCRNNGRPCVNDCPFSCKRSEAQPASSGTSGRFLAIWTPCTFWVVQETCMNSFWGGCTCGTPTRAFQSCQVQRYWKLYSCR
jgi:hypothetical protein